MTFPYSCFDSLPEAIVFIFIYSFIDAVALLTCLICACAFRKKVSGGDSCSVNRKERKEKKIQLKNDLL